MMTKDSTPPRGTIKLYEHMRFDCQGTPLSVSGTLTVPWLQGSGRFGGAIYHDEQGSPATLELDITEWVAPIGRPKDEPRRIAVALAVHLMTVVEEMKHTQAHEEAARLLYKGGDASQIRRVLRATETQAAMKKGRVFACRHPDQPEKSFAMLLTEHRDIDMMTTPIPAGDYDLTLTGWAWQRGDLIARFGKLVVRGWTPAAPSAGQ